MAKPAFETQCTSLPLLPHKLTRLFKGGSQCLAHPRESVFIEWEEGGTTWGKTGSWFSLFRVLVSVPFSECLKRLHSIWVPLLNPAVVYTRLLIHSSRVHSRHSDSEPLEIVQTGCEVLCLGVSAAAPTAPHADEAIGDVGGADTVLGAVLQGNRLGHFEFMSFWVELTDETQDALLN